MEDICQLEDNAVSDLKEPVAARARRGSGYAKSTDTRERIVAAALKVFGERGFTLASTREIAAAAGVVPPALHYHFGGKEGLHRECGEVILREMMVHVLAPLERARGAALAGTPAEAVEAVCELLDAMFLAANGSDMSPLTKKFFAFAQLDAAQPAFSVVRERMLSPVYDACLGLVAKVTRLPTAHEEARAIALLLVGQVRTLSVQRQRGFMVASQGVGDDTWTNAVRVALRRVVRGALR